MLAIDLSQLDSYLAWLDKQPARLVDETRGVYRSWAAALHKEITELTPQWSGNLASNWALDIGAPSTAPNYFFGPAKDQPYSEGMRSHNMTPYSRGMHPAVGVSLERAKQTGTALLSEDYYIHNPVAYADSIEDDTSDPPVRAINRLPRSEAGKIAMVYHAYAKHSQDGQALLNELRNRAF